MFEKVNPFHPDKVADRIAGAIVDLAYRKQTDPRIAVEVLLGHGKCNIIAESSAPVTPNDCHAIVQRIAGRMLTYTTIVPQDQHLADNQQGIVRCGDNGIFKGMPVNEEQHQLTEIAKAITEAYPFDGKYIINAQKHSMVLCQSNLLNKNWSYLMNDVLQKKTGNINDVFINPLGEWTGGTNVDCGATNRKLGSDMGDAVTGGGLHGKDLSKADVTLNIYCHIKAQETGKPYELCCAIGDEYVDGRSYGEIVEIARKYIRDIGGFEKFAEWGLIR